MDKVSAKLFKLIDDKGCMAVGTMLGHSSSQRLEVWKRKKRIPVSQIGAVETILTLNGHLNPKDSK